MSRAIRTNIDLKAALKIYYKYPNEIGTEQISQIFGGITESTIARRKKEVRIAMAESKPPVRSWNPAKVDTETAYKVWGLDIAKLERSYKKLLALGLDDEQAEST